MQSRDSVTIRGTFSHGTFVAAEPLPDAEGPAELIVHVQAVGGARPSIYDVFGKAKQVRTAADIDAQLAEERAAWDDVLQGAFPLKASGVSASGAAAAARLE